MNVSSSNKTFFSYTILFTYILFFTGLFFSFRAVASISTGLLLITGCVLHKRMLLKVIYRNKAFPFLVACSLYFLLLIISLVYHPTAEATWKDLQLKSGLVLIPLAIIVSDPGQEQTRKRLRATYCGVLVAACLYCLLCNFMNWLETGDGSVFFYHKLVKPLRQHAVYFSIYTFVALIFLLKRGPGKITVINRGIEITILIFLSAFLFFLSSKLVLAFYLLYLFWFTAGLAKNKVLRRSLLIGLGAGSGLLIALLLLTNNPVGNRFRDLFNGDPVLSGRENYDPGVYFNGIQFRLLQWKLVPVILNEEKSWGKGVGAARAQLLLDRQYIKKNMYLGDLFTHNSGYRGYNTHSQFLESLLVNGIPGGILFLFICYALVRMTGRSKQGGTRLALVLLLGYAFLESVFETQYAIVLFSFFPCFLSAEEPEPTFPQPKPISKGMNP